MSCTREVGGACLARDGAGGGELPVLGMHGTER